MKKVLTVLSIAAVIAACQPKQPEESQEVIETVPTVAVSYYGEQIDSDNLLSLADMHDQLESADSTNAKIEGTIVQTCKMKGCWMKVVMADGDTMRVTFKDYGFFVPKEGVEGKRVVFEGLAKKDVTSVETLQHFAKDGGASEEEIAAITEPKEEVKFIASGVMIEGVEEEAPASEE